MDNIIDFTNQEQAFISAVFKEWNPPSYSIFVDMLSKVIETKLVSQGYDTLNIPVLHSIQEKIFHYNADQELDAILSGTPNLKFKPQFNTKTASLKALTNLGERHYEILSVLENSDFPLSRQDIADLTGMKHCSVCGRVDELLALGRITLVGTKRDPDTKRQVGTLTIKGTK